jgi:hypothetical protein
MAQQNGSDIREGKSRKESGGRKEAEISPAPPGWSVHFQCMAYVGKEIEI